MAVPNPGAVDGDQFTAARFGFKTDRANANLPQTASTAYFTIAGGRVLLLGLVGQVGTAIQAQANAIKWIATPSAGTAVDICATVDVNGKEAGTLLGITGLFTAAMLASNAGATVMATNAVVLPVGTVNLNTAASNTGTTKWSAFWLPLDSGASLVAA